MRAGETLLVLAEDSAFREEDDAAELPACAARLACGGTFCSRSDASSSSGMSIDASLVLVFAPLSPPAIEPFLLLPLNVGLVAETMLPSPSTKSSSSSSDKAFSPPAVESVVAVERVSSCVVRIEESRRPLAVPSTSSSARAPALLPRGLREDPPLSGSFRTSAAPAAPLRPDSTKLASTARSSFRNDRRRSRSNSIITNLGFLRTQVSQASRALAVEMCIVPTMYNESVSFTSMRRTEMGSFRSSWSRAGEWEALGRMKPDKKFVSSCRGPSSYFLFQIMQLSVSGQPRTTPATRYRMGHNHKQKS